MEDLKIKTIAALTKQVELLDKGGLSSAGKHEAAEAVSSLTNLLAVLNQA